MKVYFVVASILLSIMAFAQSGPQDTYFTNRAEAQNSIKDGLKEGKWVEYLAVSDKGTLVVDSSSATCYRLTIYRAGKPCGVVKEYSMNGILLSETPYVQGKRNGVSKEYSNRNGNLLYEDI